MKSNNGKMTFRFSERDANDDMQTLSPQVEEVQQPDSVAWSEWQHQASMIIKESETDRVERWIRSADQEDVVLSSVDKHSEEDVRDGMEPPHEQRLWSINRVYDELGGVHKHPRSSSMMKIAGSVVGAIATGLLFGFLALSLLRGEVKLPNGTDAVAAIAPSIPMMGEGKKEAGKTSETEKQVQGDKVGVAGEQSNKPSTATITVDVKAASAYVLQYGVFAKVEGADQAIAELQQLGLGAVREEVDGQFRVYAAISDRRDDAMLLSEALQANQISLYVKALERPAMTKLAYEGDAETINGFVLQSDKVREWLVQHSSQMLQQSKQVAFDSQVMTELRTEHLRWTQWGQKMQQQMSTDHEANWLKLVQSMNTAISAVNEYNKKPAGAHLWTIQQACIQYMLLEREWLAAMKV